MSFTDKIDEWMKEAEERPESDLSDFHELRPDFSPPKQKQARLIGHACSYFSKKLSRLRFYKFLLQP